jgi:transcriptional regulator with XRE-family HTH domain
MTTTSSQAMPSSQATNLKSKTITPLQYQRLLRGWSQAELAARIYALCIRDGHPQAAITHQSIHQWERGKHRPTPLYRKQLCEIFGMNALQLGFLNDLQFDQPASHDPLATQAQDSNIEISPNKHKIHMLVRGHAQDARAISR